MLNNSISLHSDPRRILFIAVSFSLMLSLVIISVIYSASPYLTQYYSLCQSSYSCSVTVRDSVDCNGFFQFDAGISFMLAADSNTRLNADVIMQNSHSCYSEAVNWAADELDVHSVAVSGNLVRACGLSVGDCLYSKNVVDGKIYEYSIAQILPDTTGMRTVSENDYCNGIIIMGYDELYVSNVAHRTIAFVSGNVEAFLKESSDPGEIIYRKDELASAAGRIALFAVPGMVLIALLTVALVYTLARPVKSNYRRLIMQGFDKHRLNRAFYRSIWIPSLISFLLSLGISLLIFSILRTGSFIVLLCFLGILLIEILTLLSASLIIRNRIWRT